jgi:type VI secretion system protein VasD
MTRTRCTEYTEAGRLDGQTGDVNQWQAPKIGVQGAARIACAALLCAWLSACGTTPPGEGLLDKALGMVGLQKLEPPAPPAAPAMPAITPEMLKALVTPAPAPPPTKIPLRIHASNQLNSDGAKRPLSLVVKIYKLKGHEEFMRAPYASFTQASLSQEEVVSSRELVLLPGQRYEVEENLPKNVTHLGVVALFKSPEAYRWRFVFDVASSTKEGVTLGAHQCALSVSQGETVGSPAEFKRLAGTVCR